MNSRLDAVCVHAEDPSRLAGFWAGVLGWDLETSGEQLVGEPAGDGCSDGRERPWVVLADPDGNAFRLLSS